MGCPLLRTAGEARALSFSGAGRFNVRERGTRRLGGGCLRGPGHAAVRVGPRVDYGHAYSPPGGTVMLTVLNISTML